MISFRLAAFVLILLVAVSPLRAAPGGLDPTYDVRCSQLGEVKVIVRQPDGKLVIGGTFAFANGVRRPSIARLNADGSLDASFNAGDGITSLHTYRAVQALAVQPDGKILVAGLFSSWNGELASNVVRLNTDGSRDRSIGSVEFDLFSDGVSALGLQSDGRILVGGSFRSIQGVERPNFARLHADGTLDTSFDVMANGTVGMIVPDGVGGWFIGGGFTTLGGMPRAGLAHLSANGSVDPAFTPPALPTYGIVEGVLQMPDGRILYCGYQPGTIWADGFVRRLQSDGTPDQTFGPPAFTGGPVRDLAILEGDSVLLGGSFAAANGAPAGALLRLSANGALDPTLQLNASYAINDFVSLPDGGVVFGGSVFRVGQELRLGVSRVLANGTLDLGFHPDTTIASSVRKLTKMSGGRRVVVGGFDGIHSSTVRGTQFRLGRLDAVGQPDPSFSSGATPVRQFNAVAEQSDGRLLAGGESYSSAVLNLLHRFNPDGSLDSGFTPTFGSFDIINALAVQPDDKIVVGGRLTKINGASNLGGVFRLLANGLRDPSFSGASLGDAFDLVLMPAGKIVVAGAKYLSRLQPDGSYDESFKRSGTFGNGPVLNGPVYSVAVLPGQRLLIAGDFTTINGQAVGRVARLLGNGELDTTFGMGAGADAAVRAIAVRADGEIFLTGDFQTLNGVPRPRLGQLSPEGAVRMDFDPMLGLDGVGYALSIDSSTSLLVGGGFTSVNGLNRFGLARVETTPLGALRTVPSAPASFSATAVTSNQVLLVWSEVPTATGFIVERSNDGNTRWLSLGSPAAGATSFMDTTVVPGQTYHYRIIPWNAGGDAPSSGINVVSLPTPDTVAGAVLPGNALDLWTRGDARVMARQADGKLIVGGSFTRVHGVPRINLARLNADGSLDATFDAGPGLSRTVNSIVIQADGKIVIGCGDPGLHSERGFVRRYLADGTPDPGFAAAQPDGPVNCLLLLPDGGFIVGGGFTKWGSVTRQNLARLHSDGSLDTTYTPARPSDTVSALALQSDGKFLVGGGFSIISNPSGFPSRATQVARLNADGTIDPSFGSVELRTGGFNTGTALALCLQADGKVIVGGIFSRLGAQGILRLTTTGAVDTTFNTGLGASATVYAVAQLSDGRIGVGGDFLTFAGSSRPGFAVLSSTGDLQGAEVAIFPPAVRTLLPAVGGQCVIGGPFHGVAGVRRQAVARILSDGNTVDTTFAASLSRPGQAYGLAEQSDGKTLVIGDFTSIGGPDDLGIPRYGLMRLERDDSVDPRFLGTFGFNGAPRTVAEGAGGKVWVGGDFTAIGSLVCNRVARLLSNGALDPSFDAGAGPNSAVNALVAESDGGVTVGGTFSASSGQIRNRLARFSATGTLTADFNEAGANGAVSALMRQPDGGLLVAGSFTRIQSQDRPYLARLNADGLVDVAFAPSPNGEITSLIPAGNGRLLVAGSFSSIGGASRSKLARLLATGVSDPSFAHLVNGSSFVTGIVSGDDGSCIAMGALFGVVDYRLLRVARFFQSGAFDSAFDVGGSEQFAPVAGVASSSRVLLGGSFQRFSGQPRLGLVRLRVVATATEPEAPSPLVLSAFAPNSVSFTWASVPDPSGFVVERSPVFATTWQAIALLSPSETSYTDVDLAAGSAWRYRVSAFNITGFSAPSNILPVTVPSSFVQWRLAFSVPASTPANTDLDGDGLGIFAEYALGLLPRVPDNHQVFATTIEGDKLQLTYFRAQAEASYTVQSSVDLLNWTAVGIDQGEPGPWVTASAPIGIEGRKFLRVFVTDRQ